MNPGMKKMIIPVAFLLIFISAGTIHGQNLRATSRIDTTRMLIGDQVNLWFEVEQPTGIQVAFPALRDSLAGKIEVLSSSPVDTLTRNGNMLKLRQRILLTSFDTGFFVIPGFVFKAPGFSDSVRTEALGLEVMGIPVDTTKGITDIKLPYEVPVTFSEVLPYIIVGLLLIAIIILYIWYLRKRRAVVKELVKPDIPPVPAHIWALGELDELVREKLWQQGKTKLYYSRLTDIIRRYIELRFSRPAMEQTTDEIMADFRGNGLIPQAMQDDLRALLQLADLVKFAKWSPDAEESEASQKSAYDFILRTKPVVNLREPDKEEAK
jgi:hypothetical protein